LAENDFQIPTFIVEQHGIMKHFCALVFLLLSNFLCFGQFWQATTNFPSAERDDATGFAIGNFFYVGTGLTSWFAPTSDFYKYNASNATWAQVAGLPQGEERQYACGFSHANSGFVFGGLRDTNYLNDLWRYDAQTDSWQQVASLPAAGRSGATCFVLADTAYFVGGKTKNNLATNEVWAYNIATNSWQQKGNFPAGGRWRASSAATFQKGYLLFGKDEFGNYPPQFYDYNAQTDQWTNLGQFPLAGRTHAQLVAQFNTLYVLMGIDSSATFAKDIWRFELVNSVWTQLNDLPAAPRRGGVAFAIQAPQLFYTTGLDSAGTRTNQSWLYNLPISITENALDKTVKIYPNPCAEFLNINLENLPKKALLSVYSVDGKFLFSQVLTEKNTKLNVQALAAGNYFLRIEIGNTTLIKSFSKH